MFSRGRHRSKVGGNRWLAIVIFGLLGQIAWGVEGNYLDFFMDRTITTNPLPLALMLGLSAVVSTLTTFVMGIISDRVGRRKPFMIVGFVIWGFTIMAFSLIFPVDTLVSWGWDKETAVITACACLIGLDCLMTFFGATANDTAFSAWITESIEDNDRGKVESILSIMGLLSNFIIFIFLDSFTQNSYFDANGNPVEKLVDGGTVVHGNWPFFFCTVGLLVIVAGFVGSFLIKESPKTHPNPSSKFSDIIYGFRPKVMKKNRIFYLALLVAMVVALSNACISAYLMIYMQRTLEYSSPAFTLLGVSVQQFAIYCFIIYGSSAFFSILIGFIMDKTGHKEAYILPAIIGDLAGLLGMFLASPVIFGSADATPVWLFIVFALLENVGLNVFNISALTIVRSYTPEGQVGLFQGVKVFFMGLIPTCVGPLLTVFINNLTAKTEIINGETIYTYQPSMFIVAAVILVPAFFAAYFLKRNVERAEHERLERAKYFNPGWENPNH